MSEHEASRVVQAPVGRVFEVAAQVERLPEWLPTVEHASAADPGPGAGAPTTQVHVEGDSGGGHYASDGFWRPDRDQLRVEWGSPSRGGEPGGYAGWLQVADSAAGGSEVTVHLSFLEQDAPHDVERDLAASLDALADLVEG